MPVLMRGSSAMNIGAHVAPLTVPRSPRFSPLPPFYSFSYLLPARARFRPAEPCLLLPDEDYQLLADLFAITAERGELVRGRPGRRNAKAGQAARRRHLADSRFDHSTHGARNCVTELRGADGAGSGSEDQDAGRLRRRFDVWGRVDVRFAPCLPARRGRRLSRR